MKTRDQNIWEESDLKNFQDLMLALDACYWLHNTISLSLSRFEDDPKGEMLTDSCFSEDLMYSLVLCLYVYFYLRVKVIYVVHISICFDKKIRPFIVIFDGLFETLYTGQGEGV